MEKENLNVDFTGNWTPGKVVKIVRKLESEENQKLVKTEEMENVEKRRIFVEENPEKYEELPRKKEPAYLKRWKDLEKGNEREERPSKEKGKLEPKSSPALW